MAVVEPMEEVTVREVGPRFAMLKLAGRGTFGSNSLKGLQKHFPSSHVTGVPSVQISSAVTAVGVLWSSSAVVEVLLAVDLVDVTNEDF